MIHPSPTRAMLIGLYLTSYFSVSAGFVTPRSLIRTRAIPGTQTYRQNDDCVSPMTVLNSTPNNRSNNPNAATFNPGPNGDDDKIPDDVPDNMNARQLEEVMQKRTLYEVLGASPTMSRAEIKQRYVQLAKQSHPDARIGQSISDQQVPDFGEISQAWRVLGDSKTRLRYDRTLRMEAWSENAQKYANERLEKAVPAVSQILDKVAIPFLRRTTTTTVAVASAVSQGFGGNANDSPESRSNNNNDRPGVTEAFRNAFKASQAAGRVIDSIELAEKAKELMERAEQEEFKLRELNQQVEAVTEKRLFATLQSDQYALSSDEAGMVLDRLGLRVTADASPLLKVARSNIANEIELLRDAETTFQNNLSQYEQTDVQWNDLLAEEEDAKATLEEMQRIENQAREAWERAQRDVRDAKERLASTANTLRSVERQVKVSASDMDKITQQLSKRQDNVRNFLRDKVQAMREQELDVPYVSEDKLQYLLHEESKLVSKRDKAKTMVDNLISRASKLEARSEALERWQQQGQSNDQVNGRNDYRGGGNGRNGTTTPPPRGYP